MLFDPDRNLIIYEGEEAALARPYALKANGNYAVVEATYPNLLRLNGLDLDVPDPMHSYDWPIQPGLDPLPGQCEVASSMVLNPRSFVFSDMRTGKTLASLWAADWLMRHATHKLRCLVLSDIAALEDTWAAAIRNHFLGRRRAEILYGSADKRELALTREADFYLLNHDALRIGMPKKIFEKDPTTGRITVKKVEANGLYKALVERRFDIVVFDEAATYRNYDTDTSRCALEVSRHSSFVWLMTGTPTPNGALDAHGLKRLCHPETKLSFKTWRDRVTYPAGPLRREPREDAVEQVCELLQPAIRITQEQCFASTPLKTLDLECSLSDEQRQHMRDLKNELAVLLRNGAEIKAVNEAALRAKLIQISCGAVYDEDHTPHYIDASPRLSAFRRLVDRIPGKIIAFAPLISIVQLLVRNLEGRGVAINNGLSKKAKLEMMRKWQEDPGIKVIVSHPGPIARGVDLTAASTIIWYAPVDRTEYQLQANERINGVNQKNDRHIIRMYGHKIEKGIYERNDNNQRMQGLILQLAELAV